MNRRQMIATSIAGAGALASLPRVSAGTAPSGDALGAADSPELAAATTAGVRYFQQRCEHQLPLLRRLESAIRSGDLRAAQDAYVDSRPPYEEIETTALCFESSDRDIDARPYAFEGGELDEDFRGFHKIEAILFGYQETAAALPYAQELIRSVQRLGKELAERDRFSAARQFDGMVMLATEVAAKKISSEEETWSDQSLVIFRSNWIGVRSQFVPFRGLIRDAKAVERVDAAHREAMALLEDHFAPGRVAGTPYSRIRMRERRSMADASNRLRDALLGAREALGV
jgi:iron uptake system component EfeO